MEMPIMFYQRSMSGRSALLGLLLLVVFSSSQAQDRSNKGKEFWLGYGHNILFTADNPVNAQTLVLYLSAEQAATVTVSVNGTSFSQTVNIPANTVDFSITIPKTGANDARILAEGLSTKGVHIVSDVPIVAYAHEYGLLSSGATMLMPVETFGYTYYSLNYTQSSNYPNCFSWFYVVASENNTRLLITPSDTTQGGWLPTQSYTVNLNKGEIYNVFGKSTGSLVGKDMSGSKIVSIAGADGSCHPVAVFSGSSRNDLLSPSCTYTYVSGGNIYNVSGNGGEFMMQQIFPANAWGTKYITYHTINNTGGNIVAPFYTIYRVAVRNPSTVVKRNGTVLTGLINNFYYEFTSSSGDVIEADQPILVAQYTTSTNQCAGATDNPSGDPEMIYLSPIEQGVKSAMFYNTRKQDISLNFVNIIVPVAGVASLLIDGTAPDPAEYVPHPVNSNYAVVVRRLYVAAQHSITCDSTFISTVYGTGVYESYGYNVGTLVNNLNAIGIIKNVYNTSGNLDTFTCPKTPLRLLVKLAYKATSINWHLSQVTGAGISPNVDSIINNPVPIDSNFVYGRKYYTYTLQQDFTFANIGSYYVPVTYTSPDIDNCNQTENTTIKVVVKAGPDANFTFSAANCLTDTVHLTGTTVANGFNLIGYIWSFDDNTTASGIDTVKKFATPGNHDVKFLVYADNGCAGTTTKTISVLPSPVAAFGATNICSGDSTLITDNSSVTQGSITNWYWNFGDNSTATLTNGNAFKHKYVNAGNYTIYLIATSSNGCKSDTAKQQIVVSAKPVAKFTSSGSVCLGQSVLFTDNSSATQGSMVNWKWDFGDGNTQAYTNAAPFNYTYTAASNYTVSLNVTGSNGCISDTFKLPMTIFSKPVATITALGKPCIDSMFTFTSSIVPIAGTPITWYWDYGNMQTQTINTTNIATKAYNATASNLIVRHAVDINNGCRSDTVPYAIPFIKANPVTNFSIVGDTLCEHKPLQFTAPSNPLAAIWQWDFGNGTGNDVPPFYRTYATANNYSPTLKVFTAEGCGSAPVSKNMTIYPAPVVNAGTDKFINAGSSVTMDASIVNPSDYTFLWTPSQYLNDATLLNPLCTPLSMTNVYVIHAYNQLSKCEATDTVMVTALQKLIIPNAFSPNGDRINDTWDIPSLQTYPDALVEVYNRNGQQIFQAPRGYPVAWNGTYNGKQLPVGVYYYIIRIKSADAVLSGSLTILR